MNKLISTILLAVFLTISFNSLAQDTSKDIGVGFMVGEPTGLSFKSWTGGNNALDLGVAWSLGRYDAINIHADYLWHNYEVIGGDVDSGSLPLYYGIGGRVILAENDAILGARVPVGLNYLFEDSPIGLFIEVAPIFNIAPSTDFDVDGGVGIRYYF